MRGQRAHYRAAFARAAFVLAAVLGILPAFAQERLPSMAKAAEETLKKAQDLYAAGSYEGCRELVGPILREYEAQPASYPPGIIARLYRLDALISYTFRDEGYADEIANLLRKAIVLDLDLDIGDPAEVPFFVINTFTKVRSAYLAQFSRMAKRSAVGVFGAVVLEPTVFQNISLLEPGIFYAFNLTDVFSLDAQLRFPLQTPIWNSIRGQIGLLWSPSFRVEKIATGIFLYYIFGLDNLSTYSHSLAFGGRMEYVTRSGIGFAGSAELLRADLVFGSQAPASPPAYTEIPFIGVGRVVFANITIYMLYSF
ncbi:MAG: hypothetical protein ABSG21_06495 [Spirochaetia bacterium]|jgi:hypothetical protein